VTEPEVIEGYVAHQEEALLPAVRPGTLLEGSSPAGQIANAQIIARQLADVIDKQHLYADIKGKRHVLYEGWTLLGSLLGVFPVVEWTKQLDNGWEARVVAKTLMGAEVGAAEAMCTREESRWSKADEYAIRSMAQTRAGSKALRLPLGFVMQLAGYEATPAEEMPHAGAVSEPTPVGGPKPLDVSSWPKITKAVSAYDEQTHDVFFRFAAAARKLLYGVDTADELTKPQKAELLRTAGLAALRLRDKHEPDILPFPSVEDQRQVWASVLEGQELAIPEDSDDD
jgi:hypothetical protein